MSDDESTVEQGVRIGRDHGDVPVRVELWAYLCFSRRMDSQLRRLVARWRHASAPGARRASKESHRTRGKRR